MKKMLNKYKSLIYIIIALVANAFGVAAFILPYNFVIGGATGLARVLNYTSGVSISLAVGVINIIILIVAFITMGKKFAGTIVLGSVLYPVLLELFGKIHAISHLTDNVVIAAIFGGMFLGGSVGVIIRNGGASGGADVPPIILNKKMGWPIAPVLYVQEACIILAQIFFASSEQILLGLFITLVCSVVMNKVIVSGRGEVQIMIFSPKYEEICDTLLNTGFGTTLMHGKTGYLGEERETIICVTSNRSVNKLKTIVLAIDPKTFMTISEVREVNGVGFTLGI